MPSGRGGVESTRTPGSGRAGMQEGGEKKYTQQGKRSDSGKKHPPWSVTKINNLFKGVSYTVHLDTSFTRGEIRRLS